MTTVVFRHAIRHRSSLSVVHVATALGIPARDRVILRCPACGAAQRGRHDRRGPIGLTTNRNGWRCFACGAGGDAPDFVAYALIGERMRHLGRAELRRVHEWFAEHDRLGAIPLEPVVSESASASSTGEGPPPAAEVEAFWGSCHSILESAETLRWLRLRRVEAFAIDPYKAATEDLARSLPRSATAPGWATVGKRPWTESGHRLIVPAFDHDGRLRSVRARSVVPGAYPKSLAPAAGPGSSTGLILANAPGRSLLQGARLSKLWIAEGETDFLALATYPWAVDEPAVFGIVAGSWTPEIAARIPPEALVILATDPDAVGERYARQIATTLEQHPHVYRYRATFDVDPSPHSQPDVADQIAAREFDAGRIEPFGASRSAPRGSA